MNLSENYFIELAKTNPLELKKYLIGSKSNQVSEGLRTRGAEACQYIEDHQLARQILLPLLSAGTAIVQEGALYGLIPHIDKEVFEFLQEKLYNEFTHPIIKEIISDYLNDFDILIQVLESFRNLPESKEDYDNPPNDLAINNAKLVLQKISDMSLDDLFNLKDLEINVDAMGGIAINNERWRFSFMNDGNYLILDLKDWNQKEKLRKDFIIYEMKKKLRKRIEEDKEKWKISKNNPDNWTEKQKQDYIDTVNWVNSLE